MLRQNWIRDGKRTCNYMGIAISAYKGSLTDITTYLSTKDSEHISTLSLPAETRAGSIQLAAALGGVVLVEKCKWMWQDL